MIKSFLQYFLFLCTVCYFNSQISAQVNTEKYRSKTRESGFTGTSSIDATINSGNNDKKEIGFEGHYDFNLNSTRMLLVLKGEYGFVNSKEYSDKALAHFRYLYRLSKKFKLEIYSQYDFDKNRLLLNRKLAGIGVRPLIFRNKQSTLWFGLSFLYETEKFEQSKNSIHPKNDYSGRLSSYLTYQLYIEKNIKLSCVIYFQPKVGARDDAKALGESSLLVDISKNIGLRIDFNLRYDSRPPDSIKELDTRSKFGITYTF